MKKRMILFLFMGITQISWADDLALDYPEPAQQIQHICDLSQMVQVDAILARYRGTDKKTALAQIRQHPDVLVLRQKINLMDEKTIDQWIADSLNDGYGMADVIPKHYAYEHVDILARHSTGAGHEVCMNGLANKYRAALPLQR